LKKILFLILSLVLFIACEEDRPSNILSQGKMEDVLYDYHLAQAMIDQLDIEEREKMAQAYIDAVYEKYDITEAEFDSSLVYYNRNAKELNEIYANLRERYEDYNRELSLATGNDVMTAYSQNGDTANIWSGAKLVMLKNKEGLNYSSFTFNSDSSFHRKDKFLLICNTILISETNNSSDSYVNIGLTITYKDGKTTASTIRTSSTREMQLNVASNDDKDIQSVSGYFYYNTDCESRNLAFVSNIGLVRMRTVVETPKTIETDSISVDSTATKPELNIKHERLTPEQIRKQNQSENHIKIKAAPDVRTPNSDFRRRKTARPATSNRNIKP